MAGFAGIAKADLTCTNLDCGEDFRVPVGEVSLDVGASPDKAGIYSATCTFCGVTVVKEANHRVVALLRDSGAVLGRISLR